MGAGIAYLRAFWRASTWEACLWKQSFKMTPPQKQDLDPSRDSGDFSRGRRALRIYVHFGGHPHGRPACGSKALNDPPLPQSPLSLKSSTLIHAGIPGTFRGGGGHCIFTCILACIQMGGLLVEAKLSNDPTPPHQKQGLDPSRGSWDFLWGRALHIYVHFGEHPHGRPACGSKALK